MGHDTPNYRTIPILQEEKTYFPSNRIFPTNLGMDAVRKLILEKIDERGLTLKAVSEAIGRNHAYLQQFINRNVHQDLPEKVRPLLAAQLGVDEDDLKPQSLKVPIHGSMGSSAHPHKAGVATASKAVIMSHPGQNVGEKMTPGHQLVGEADLPVFGTAQGGRGALVISDQPVDWVVRPAPLLRVRDGYGVIVTGDSMSPEHKSGSTALVNPHLPWRAGDTCVFRSTADDGAVHMCIKELVRFTDDTWYVRQHNPKKSFSLKRSEWQDCHVTVGNYARR